MVYTGNYRLGDLFESRREKGSLGLPLLSVTLTNGMVNREELKRKQETELSDEEHLVVRKGDIAYNMMRMWQGASGLAIKDGIISPAYVVLAPKAGIDSEYASYLFKTKRLIYMFWAFSYGLTEDRLRLYFSDFAKIPVNIPKLKEQKRISKILVTWDKAITTVEKIIKNRKVQKKAIMQQLLAGERRLPGFYEKWGSVRLADVAEIIVSNVDKKISDDEKSVMMCNYTDVYHNQYITQAMNFKQATASEAEIKKFSLKKSDVLITKDSESADDIAVSACVRENLKDVVCGYHLAIIRPKRNMVDGVFLSNLFSLDNIRYHFASRANGVTRFGLSVDAIREAVFSIPTFKEQRKISQLILVADDEIAVLRKRLDALKLEKQALMQQLLSGKRRVKVDELLLHPLQGTVKK